MTVRIITSNQWNAKAEVNYTKMFIWLEDFNIEQLTQPKKLKKN